MFLLCSNELHNCEHTSTKLCKVVREQLEKGLFTLGKLDFDFYSTGILYSSLNSTYTTHRTLSFYCQVLSGRMQKNKKAFSLQRSHTDSACNIGCLKVANRQFQGKFQRQRSEQFFNLSNRTLFIQTEKQFPFINLLNLVYLYINSTTDTT